MSEQEAIMRRVLKIIAQNIEGDPYRLTHAQLAFKMETIKLYVEAALKPLGGATEEGTPVQQLTDGARPDG